MIENTDMKIIQKMSNKAVFIFQQEEENDSLIFVKVSLILFANQSELSIVLFNQNILCVENIPQLSSNYKSCDNQ